MYKQNNEELAFSYGVVVPNHVHDCIPIRLQVTNPYWDIARRALWSYEVMEMYVAREQVKRREHDRLILLLRTETTTVYAFAPI